MTVILRDRPVGSLGSWGCLAEALAVFGCLVVLGPEFLFSWYVTFTLSFPGILRNVARSASQSFSSSQAVDRGCELLVVGLRIVGEFKPVQCRDVGLGGTQARSRCVVLCPLFL